jgi:succinate dehydrogenase / fumarate reductase cytochrome b subunit
MTVRRRPRSPNVQIYRPQLTSVLSIGHRLSGVLLSLGTVLLIAWLLAAASGPEAYAVVQGVVHSFPGSALLLAWTFAVFYHLCNGIRHLFWDCGKGLELGSIYASGWAVVIASIVLTAAAWLVGLTAA